ncbi:hypothetical protein WNZ15_00810 [Roseibium sp. AS2]|uniref:hypothetical protein n=1 Tax=Roseibium sp. AS2 TaxID=3135781 RepID=UPI003181402F
MPVKVVVPVQGFDGVMVRIVPGAAPGDILATLILKHPDSALSITLAETEHSDDLAEVAAVHSNERQIIARS